MNSSRTHPALVWLCLIWFGLTNTLLARGMVVCRDGHGGSRIEWGCDQNASGECIPACGSERDGVGDDAGPAHPCDDTPIKGDHQLAKSPSRSTVDLAIPVPVIPAEIVSQIDLAARAESRGDLPGPRRPPDTLQRLRSVVLVV